MAEARPSDVMLLDQTFTINDHVTVLGCTQPRTSLLAPIG
jgi:hypothetical protein